MQQVAEFNDSWKGRGSLRELVAELTRQRESRVDFVADQRSLRAAVAENGEVNLIARDKLASDWLVGPTPMNRPAWAQWLDSCQPSPPIKYADALLAADPAVRSAFDQLLDESGKVPQRRLVRMLDGRVRAVLSDRYRALDNYDLMWSTLETAEQVDARVIECSLSETHMRVKLVSPNIWTAIALKQEGSRDSWFSGGLGNQQYLGRVGARSTGDLPGGPGALYPVVTLSNSETGHGRYNVRLGVLLGICYNVATVEDVVKEVHLGSRLEEGLYSDDTITLDAQAIMAKARDSVRAAFTPERFAALANRITGAEKPIESPAAAVDSLVKAGDISKARRDELLTRFVADYQPSTFGLAQAVSRLAQDEEDGDEAVALEDLAGRILVGVTS